MNQTSLLLLILGCVSTTVVADEPRRNLLIITADDMNADSSGWMGNPLSPTPTLDALAAASHRMVNHHVTAPICQPSREALMTGRVPHRSGGLGFTPIRSGTPTLISLLKAQGYFTGVIDKHPHMKPDAEFPWDVKLSGSGKNPPLMREHMDQLLSAAGESKKPFFINANVTDPHRPFPGGQAGVAETADSRPKKKAQQKTRKAEKLANAAKHVGRVFSPEEVPVPSFLEDIPPVRKELAQYYSGVARMDSSLSQILSALNDSGNSDNTVIMFLSDHGMSFPFSKATVYRNGTWSPVLLKYPGMSTAAVHQEFLSSVDILPTLLDILGVKHPEGLDGTSWLPLLQGQSQSGRDFVVTHVNTVSSGKSFAQRCIRTRDFALLFHAWPDGTEKFRVEAMNGITFNALEAAGKNDPQIASRVRQLRVGERLMFFDEQSDPGERTNLISSTAHGPEIERLGTLLLNHMERTEDPQTSAFRTALDAWKDSQQRR
jgi:N-sulfoglucosamine sulfohydrolase